MTGPGQDIAAQTQGPGSQGVSPGGSSSIFDIPAHPTGITVTLESTSAVESVVPIEGGTLTANGTDGTVYQLIIPPDALQSESQITMTPVAAIRGLPFGAGQAFAVQLAPEGLFLSESAILTITPSQPIPVNQQVLFGYQGAGENLILALPVKNSSEIKIQLLHFSGYGVAAEVNPSGVAPVAGGAPVTMDLGSDADSRLENTAAEQAQNERRGSDNIAEQFLNAYQQYKEKVLGPRIEAAGESCAAGRLALQTILNVMRQAQLLGYDEINDELHTEMIRLVPIVAENCMKEEYERCQADHVFHRILPMYLGWQRQYQLMWEGAPEMADLDQRLRKYAEQCLRFEVVFESTVVSGKPSEDNFETRVKATVPMKFSLDAQGYLGQAPLVNEFFEYRVIDETCTVTANRGGGTFQSPQLRFLVEKATPDDELGRVSELFLVYYPGETAEEFSYQCQDYSFGPLKSPLWTGMFIAAHEADASAEGGFTAADWEIFGNEYYAKKEWQIDKPDLNLVEVGTFKLYHKPGE